MTGPDLSVVILSWNTRDLTLACLRSLFEETEVRHQREIIVVDNGSSDGSPEQIAAAYPQVRLIRNDHNRLYAVANNQGARAALGRWLVLLNSDTEVRPGALDALVEFLAANPGHGAVAPRLVHPDGSVQRSCMAFPGLLTALCWDGFLGRFPPGRWIIDRYTMKAFDHLRSRDVPQPPGAAFLMDRQEYLDIGGLDEELSLFFNDVDLCRRLWRRGRRVHYLAEAEVMHHVGASTGDHDQFLVLWHRNRATFYRKHFGFLAGPWIRFVTWLRAVEESIRIGRRHRDPARRRAERQFLWSAYREVFSR